MPWETLEIAAKRAGWFGAIIGLLIAIGILTKKTGEWIKRRTILMIVDTCAEKQRDCQSKICNKLDKMSVQRDEDKADAIARREQTEEKIFVAVRENRTLITDHYAEMRGFMGEIRGLLSDIKRNGNGGSR